ncbi:hypothetical protein EGT51_09965 [Levilactobacillus suantsaiihabitans]|uniref:Uncharacterized protein n=1 Tax=Levilactobacillus suantsaiihabitans TaxID=2487722 RepID=A0A4Z0J8I4_9LACO|nr:hypothetical protein EGT51_09965 [Levilactobacillus suantsaiihabitans]
MKKQLQPISDRIDDLTTQIHKQRINLQVVHQDYAVAEAGGNQQNMAAAAAQEKYLTDVINGLQDQRANLYPKLLPLDNARTQVSALMDELWVLDNSYIPEELN